MTLFNITTLAKFKAFLRTPGATVQLIRHDHFDENQRLLRKTPEQIEAKRATFFAPRRVKTIQTNAVEFEDGSWLYYPMAKAMRFDPDTDQVTITLDAGRPFEFVMVYQLTRQEGK